MQNSASKQQLHIFPQLWAAFCSPFLLPLFLLHIKRNVLIIWSYDSKLWLMYEMKIRAWWHGDLRQILRNYCLATISAGCYLLKHNTEHRQFTAEVIKKSISLNPQHLRPGSFPAHVSAWRKAMEAGWAAAHGEDPSLVWRKAVRAGRASGVLYRREQRLVSCSLHLSVPRRSRGM